MIQIKEKDGDKSSGAGRPAKRLFPALPAARMVDFLDTQLDAEAAPIVKLRVKAAKLIAQGTDSNQLVASLGITKATALKWITLVEKGGVPALVTPKGRGAPSLLDESQFKVLRHAINESPRKVGYDAESWSSRLLSDFISKKFQITYSESQAWRILRNLKD